MYEPVSNVLCHSRAVALFTVWLGVFHVIMGRWTRLSNRAQLIRYISDETGTPTDELWQSLDEQLGD